MMMTPYHSKNADKFKKTTSSSSPMRLNKFVAHCGICSRRGAADLVKAGQISVNGKVEINPAYEVQPRDQISYQGKFIRPEENKVYILMNKPKNTITTSKDEMDRNTVMKLLDGKIDERIYPVGRLDRNTTGLLLLTNDGELSLKLSHPSFKVKKIYHVGLDRNLTKADLTKISEGITLEDGEIKVDGIDYVGDHRDEIGVEIHSGKNRIVRRIFEHLGYEVKKLDRVFYAGLTKKNLPRGKFRHLTKQEIITLKHFMK